VSYEKGFPEGAILWLQRDYISPWSFFILNHGRLKSEKMISENEHSQERRRVFFLSRAASTGGDKSSTDDIFRALPP
jgi:hypothetical protein